MSDDTTVNATGRTSLWRILAWGMAAMLLLLPLVAMQFTAEVNWTTSDFAFAAILIGGVGTGLELVVRNTHDLSYRAGIALLLLAGFLLVWINAAVGIIGNEDNPLNLLYGFVLCTAFGGAIGAGFQARGMIRAMLAASGVQTVVGLFAIAATRTGPPGVLGPTVLNGVFVLMFVAAAWLFRRAAATSHPSAWAAG